MMMVEFKLGREMFMCLCFDCYEVVKNCEKENEKNEKTLKKEKTKSSNNCVNKYCDWFEKFVMKKNLY